MCEGGRSWRSEDFPGAEVNEAKSERRRPLFDVAEHAGAVLGVVPVRAGVLIDEAAFQGAVDEDGNLRAVAVIALALPARAARRRQNAPSAVWVRLTLIATVRNSAAARLADGCVRELRRRPPEILFRGARVSHDVKCCSVGQRVMSVPISLTSRTAV